MKTSINNKTLVELAMDLVGKELEPTLTPAQLSAQAVARIMASDKGFRVGKDYLRSGLANKWTVRTNTDIEISNPNGCDICALGDIAVDGLCVDCAEKHLPGYVAHCACGSVYQVKGGLCEVCAIGEGWDTDQEDFLSLEFKATHLFMIDCLREMDMLYNWEADLEKKIQGI